MWLKIIIEFIFLYFEFKGWLKVDLFKINDFFVMNLMFFVLDGIEKVKVLFVLKKNLGVEKIRILLVKLFWVVSRCVFCIINFFLVLLMILVDIGFLLDLK